MSVFDLAVIGAGPGGLVAARTAADKGMKVVLVEPKKEVATITRSCAQIFYLTHIGSGQAYTGPVKIEIRAGNKVKLLFPDIDLSVDYGGIARACYDWRFLSPDGTCVCTARNNLWGFVLNKGRLLQGLFDEVAGRGVEMRMETRALNVENTDSGVSVTVRDRSGKKETIKAKKAIVANGVNSRMVENLGLNKDRKQLGGTVKIFGYILEGVKTPYPPSTWVTFTYPSITPFINVWMGPMAEGTWQLAATARGDESPVKIMENFYKSSNYVSWIKDAKIVHTNSCAVTPRYPIKEPVVGNIYIAGDAASVAETWMQGAMACGYQAVRAIEQEAPEHYLTWWNGAFHFNTPTYYEELAKYPALNIFFNDEEINYLYGLMKDKVVDTIINEVLRNEEKIKKDRPEFTEKLEKIKQITLQTTFKEEQKA